jgi:hypothetical protein
VVRAADSHFGSGWRTTRLRVSCHQSIHGPLTLSSKNVIQTNSSIVSILHSIQLQSCPARNPRYINTSVFDFLLITAIYRGKIGPEATTSCHQSKGEDARGTDIIRHACTEHGFRNTKAVFANYNKVDQKQTVMLPPTKKCGMLKSRT